MFIIAATVFAMLCAGPDLALPWHPGSWYGFTTTASGKVTFVDAQAAKRCLRVGDRVEVGGMTPQQRVLSVVGGAVLAPPGRVEQLALTSGRTVTLVSHTSPRTTADNVTDDEPGHPLQGALLLPMTARAFLVGFIVCGPKSDRTHYLPEEIEALGALAHRTGSAYGWLTLRPSVQTVPLAT